MSKNKAISLKRNGFGKTTAIINYNLHILSSIELDELTQLVAISFFRAKKECKNSEKVIAFAGNGYGMSEKWWNDTYIAHTHGWLWGVHQTPTGLRRTLV